MKECPTSYSVTLTLWKINKNTVCKDWHLSFWTWNRSELKLEETNQKFSMFSAGIDRKQTSQQAFKIFQVVRQSTQHCNNIQPIRTDFTDATESLNFLSAAKTSSARELLVDSQKIPTSFLLTNPPAPIDLTPRTL